MLIFYRLTLLSTLQNKCLIKYNKLIFTYRFLQNVLINFYPQVCKKLSARKFLDSLDNQAVKAATLLCLTELYQSLGPLSVPLLPPFIAWMLELMSDTSIVKVKVNFYIVRQQIIPILIYL